MGLDSVDDANKVEVCNSISDGMIQTQHVIVRFIIMSNEARQD